MAPVPAASTFAAARPAQLIVRGAVIVLGAGAIAGTAFVWLGPPALTREYQVKNEAARFAPTIGHGLLQFGGEAFLLVVIAYCGRRWLRIRL
jgi:hypothetical protein